MRRNFTNSMSSPRALFLSLSKCANSFISPHRICTINEQHTARLKQELSQPFIQIIENTHPARSEGGKRAASRHFEKVRGVKANSNRRTGYWYAVPSRENLRKHLWCGAIWMWKYAAFKSTDATSPRGESHVQNDALETTWSHSESMQFECWMEDDRQPQRREEFTWTWIERLKYSSVPQIKLWNSFRTLEI